MHYTTCITNKAALFLYDASCASSSRRALYGILCRMSHTLLATAQSIYNLPSFLVRASWTLFKAATALSSSLGSATLGGGFTMGFLE